MAPFPLLLCIYPLNVVFYYTVSTLSLWQWVRHSELSSILTFYVYSFSAKNSQWKSLHSYCFTYFLFSWLSSHSNTAFLNVCIETVLSTSHISTKFPHLITHRFVRFFISEPNWGHYNLSVQTCLEFIPLWELLKTSSHGTLIRSLLC